MPNFLIFFWQKWTIFSHFGPTLTPPKGPKIKIGPNKNLTPRTYPRDAINTKITTRTTSMEPFCDPKVPPKYKFFILGHIVFYLTKRKNIFSRRIISQVHFLEPMSIFEYFFCDRWWMCIFGLKWCMFSRFSWKDIFCKYFRHGVWHFVVCTPWER